MLLWGFADPMHIFIKSSILYHFWHSFGARVWDIFSISGNALVNHYFSIVISCQKGEKRLLWGFADPIDLLIKSSIFHNFWHSFGARVWDIFSNFRKCAYESLLQHRNILQKSEKWLYEVLRIRCTFSLNFQFFIVFGIALGPWVWDIFLIWANALMNHFFSIVTSCKKAKNASVRFCGSDTHFH